MPSGKLLIGGVAALAALAARLGRRTEPEPVQTEEIAAGEVHELREELRRELERLASADIKASRTRPEHASSPG